MPDEQETQAFSSKLTELLVGDEGGEHASEARIELREDTQEAPPLIISIPGETAPDTKS